MSPRDVHKIEGTLGIRLPEMYKQRMTPFPVRYLAGNCSDELWDDPTAIIERNLELRADKRLAWPNHWLFIGDPSTGSANAMYLLDADARVTWIDHCDLGGIDARLGEPFEQWLSNWIAESRKNLELDGIDPDSEPPVEPKPWPTWFRNTIVYGFVASFVFLSAFGLYELVSWLLSE